MIRRLIGIITLAVGITGIGLAVAGWVLIPRSIGEIGRSLDETLGVTLDGLETTLETLVLTKATLSELTNTLATVEDNVAQGGEAIGETRPLFDQLSLVTGEDLPDGIESVQAAIPDIAQVAAIIDDTLTTLNRFRIEERILGFEINYSLGVDYDPEQPFDETVLELGEGLEGLPQRLRLLDLYIRATRGNLVEVSEGLFVLRDDVEALNGRLVEYDPLLNEYIRLMTESSDQTRLLRAQIPEWTAVSQQRARWLMIWFGLFQLTPLAVGWELLQQKKMTR